uniref:CFEM domain protein n=1 Tax=Colletotrichum fructicola (strain Nara gc5) TaxID=1213859 RepID=L2FNP0_COLFN
MILSSLASAALWLAMMPREAGASAVHLGKRGETPQANVLADTIKSCSYWYDNYEGESCVVVRDYMFAISPETFSRWNPSVGLDCSNWQDWTSYCIQVASEEPPKTTTTTASTTTTVPAQSQTPTAVLTGWNPMGCFIDDHTEGFRYAGVKSGTECWCGSFVGGDWAANQTSCNVPCPGDAKQTCGGKALLLVFEAQVKTNPLPPISIPSTTSRTTAITSSSVSLTSSTSTPSSTALPPISSLPACGQTCFLNMINTYSSLGCSTPDPACLCRNVNFGYGIRDCSNARTSNCYGWNGNSNFSYKDHFRIFHNRDHKPANLRSDMFQQHACAI